jgi:hypothetical protein
MGTRQNGRLRGGNVVDVPVYTLKDIQQAITAQIEHGPYPQSDVYFKLDTSKTIADLLVSETPEVQKQFSD